MRKNYLKVAQNGYICLGVVFPLFSGVLKLLGSNFDFILNVDGDSNLGGVFFVLSQQQLKESDPICRDK